MPTEQISLRIDTEVLQAVNLLADKEDRTRAKIINILLKEALAAREAPKKPKK
jgi:hypothetical protein